MGCASGKPESHTKKPALKQESSNRKPTNPQLSQENPEIRNDLKPIVQKQNPAPPIQTAQNHNQPQTQPINPIIEEPNKNQTVPKPQAQKTHQLQQSQVKKPQAEPIKQVKEEPAFPIETPTKDIHGSAEKKNAELSAIPQRTDEFESLKKPNPQHNSNLKVQEKKEEVRNSARDSIRNSIPDMQDEFLVSKITKNNQSAEKIQNQSSHNKQQLEHSHQKVVQSSGIKDIRTDEIKINIVDNDESRVNHSSRMSSSRPDEFAALNEQQFDLNCEFDPNTLVIDMNKVAW